MKPNNFWEFVSKNLISLSTVIVGVIVIVLDQIGVIPQNSVQVVTLALLCLLATSEMVESRKNLSKIDEKLNDLSLHVADAIVGVKVTSFSSPDDVLNYMIKRTQEARLSIDQASLDYQRGRPSLLRQKYQKTRDAVILSDKIKYRYVGVLYTEDRLERLYGRFRNKKLYNYFIGVYPRPEQEIPLFNFVVFDREEVLIRYPFSSGQDPEYMVIHSPKVVRLFLGYFEKLWENCYKIENDEDYEKIMSSMNKKPRISQSNTGSGERL